MSEVKDRFVLLAKMSVQRSWTIEVLYDALYHAELFVRDHGRPMTYKEKTQWVNKAEERIFKGEQ